MGRKGRQKYKKSSKRIAKDSFYPIGLHATKKRQQRELQEQLVEANLGLSELKNSLVNTTSEIEKVKRQLEDGRQECDSLQRKRKSDERFYAVARKRKRMKRAREFSKLDCSNSEKFEVPLGERSARRRRKETIQACGEVHGANENNPVPALDGMWCTLINEITPHRLESYISTSHKAKIKTLPAVVEKEVKKFEGSKENIIRSVKVLYSGGLLSKEKYKSIRTNLSSASDNKKKRLTFMEGVGLPKLVPYDQLVKFIQTVDFNENVNDMAALQNDNDDVVHGAYRELEAYLLVLAEMYVSIDQALGENSFIHYFGSERYHFRLAIGADGAPFGKHDEATAWLLSFLNVGSRITSQNENFLIAGANCSEDHPCMQKYAQKVIQEINAISCKSYEISGFRVKFSFELLPCDMKWLAFVAGELTNAAHFFSSFGNVNQDDKATVNASLGNNDESTWHPWSYTSRLEMAKKVQGKKQELDKTNLCGATKRKKVLEFIRSEKSRQEREPLLGTLIDFAYAEPLHLGNNGWQHLHNCILELAITKSNIPHTCTNASDIPADCPFNLYLTCLKTEVNATRLAKKVKKWFREGRKQKFDYRFTGKETKKMCSKFMFLLDAVSDESDPPETKLNISCLAYIGLQLRDIVSKFSRVETSQEEVHQLKTLCKHYFNAISLLLNNISPTVWTIGHAVPYHSDILFTKYGLGLGINSMQGREAKHVRLSQYAKHATLQKRWQLVFRHDFMATVWLRQEDPLNFPYSKNKEEYIPKHIHLPSYCYCGFSKDIQEERCKYCSSGLYKSVTETAESGVLAADICTLASVSF